ncbi:MAG: CBS domain-containing protein, partial [Arenibacter algicola]|nr:CBS domain-containing protein [Arenibacter algicola]
LGIILLDDIRPIMFDQKLYKEVMAADIMNTPPEIIELDKDKMTDIMEKFQNSGAWNLPVIKNEKYVGFISKSKLLTAYRRKLINLTS